MARIARSVDMEQPLSPATPVGSVPTEVAIATAVDSCSPRLTWLQLLPSASTASARDNAEPLTTVPVPGGISQLPGIRLMTWDHVHYEKGSGLILLELTLAGDIDTPSLPTMPLPKLPSVALENVPSAIMVFAAHGMQKWVHALGIHWFYHVPPPF